MSEQMIPLIAAAVGFVSVLLAGYGLIGYLGGASDSARLLIAQPCTANSKSS